MESVSPRTFFLWDPLKTSSFVIAQGKIIQLYTWKADQAVPVASKADVGSIRALAWSPQSPAPLLATSNGTSGAITLVSFPRSASSDPTTSTSVSTTSTTTLTPPRQSRPTAALAFSPQGPQHLLAQGFAAKGRQSDPAVLLWDVSRLDGNASGAHAASLTNGNGGGGLFPTDQPAEHGSSTADKRKPLGQLSQSDTVNDLAWLSASVLAVATQRQHIMLYDVRTPASPGGHLPILQFGPRAYGPANYAPGNGTSGVVGSGPAFERPTPIGLETDPFSEDILACWYAAGNVKARAPQRESLRESKSNGGNMGWVGAGGGLVRVWDKRAPEREVFKLEEGDGESGGLLSGPTGIKWDPERRGRLVISERGGTIGVWDLVNPKGETDESLEDGQDQDPERRLVVVGEPIRIPPPPSETAGFAALAFAYRGDKNGEVPPPSRACLASLSASQGGRIFWPSVVERWPLLFSPSSELSFGPSLFTIAPSLPPGGTSIPDPSPSVPDVAVPLLPLPDILAHRLHLNGGSSSIVPSQAPSQTPVIVPTLQSDSALAQRRLSARDPSPMNRAAIQESLQPGRARGLSTSSRRVLDDSSPVRRRNASVLLGIDIAAKMRRRAEMGYGLEDFGSNATIATQLDEQDEALSDFWKWFSAYIAKFSGALDEANHYDFSLVGVHALWHSFPPTPSSAPLSRPSSYVALPFHDHRPSGQLSSRHRNFPNSHHSPSRGGSSGLHTPTASSISLPARGMAAQFDRGCEALAAQFQAGSGGGGARIQVDSDRVARRVAGLAVLGWDLSDEDLRKEIRRLELNDDIEQAAFYGLFLGGIEHSIKILTASEKQEHIALALSLRLHLEHAASATDTESSWRGRIVNKIDSPFLRAVMSSGLGGSYDEEDLALKDQLALSLKFKRDFDVSAKLRDLLADTISFGDLAGLCLTGLCSPDTLVLLQNYLDRSSDIQTVALLAAHAPISLGPEVNRWIEAYEAELHALGMFAERARFRERRGRLARERGESVERPRQIFLRCHYCNKNVEPGDAQPTLFSRGNSSATLCPNCSNSLPRCAICLLSLGQQVGASRGRDSESEDMLKSMPLFCLTCRHGGHRAHLAEWFGFDEGSATTFSLPLSHPGYEAPPPPKVKLPSTAPKRDIYDEDDDDDSDDDDEGGGRRRNTTCPVPGCDCKCYG